MLSRALPRFRGAAIAAIFIGTAGPVHAQLLVGWDAVATVAQFKPYVPTATAPAQDSRNLRWLGQRSLGTTLNFDSRFAQVAGTGVLREGDVTTVASGASHSLIAPPVWHGLRISVSADAQHWPHDVSSTAARDSTSLALWAAADSPQPAWSSSASAHVTYARGMNGVWVSVDNRWGALVSDSVQPRYTSGGYSRQYKDLVFGISFGTQTVLAPDTPSRFYTTQYSVSYIDSAGVKRDSAATGLKGDSGVAGGVRRLSDVGASMRWASGRYSLNAILSARPHVAGLSSAAWGEASAVAAVGSRLAVLAGMRATPSLPGVTSSPRKSINLGVRIAPPALFRTGSSPIVTPVPHAFEVRPAAEGGYTLSLRLTGARTVEIAGDFSDWKPLQLHQTDAARWEIMLVLSAGTHRCNVRVDGAEWIAPSGLTSAKDEFNGRVGIFVVD